LIPEGVASHMTQPTATRPSGAELLVLGLGTRNADGETGEDAVRIGLGGYRTGNTCDSAREEWFRRRG
jgi:hypothetical protein